MDKPLCDLSDSICFTESVSTKIHGVNGAALPMSGCRREEETIGRSAFDFVAEKDQARARENVMESLERGVG